MQQNVFDKGKLKAIIIAVHHLFTFFPVLWADKLAFLYRNTQTVDKKCYERIKKEIHSGCEENHFYSLPLGQAAANIY